ncbi:hypothetical protein DV532_27380 (plasmid) [Pseudomonas sp. Leaf58]|uniref:hypothetical protein n=1 Tax=Pseudomonas sp. Leaf58 TaxID=1736226 RepID=UPI0006F99E14|nr:hypothetical protein [Pseudomonas sp. Leaf58]AYG48006.1 hypothetical protein DV532_27380 [Pseudomonas sp. Leaf58]KQN62435.1 hypothetical protein ASF02_09810 [Pseudomonas sp. Leaf58]
MQFDHIQNHSNHILYLAECLAECSADDDLLSAEKAVHALHQFMHECALRGRYAAFTPISEKIDGIIAEADSAPFVQLLAENFPVSLARVYDLMRLHEATDLRGTLIDNVATHQAVAFDPKDSVSSRAIALGKLLIKQGDAPLLCALMSEIFKYNPDALPSLIMWAMRAAPEQLSEPVLAWLTRGDHQKQIMPLMNSHFGAQWSFREMVDMKAAGVTLDFSDFSLQARGSDLLYYDFKLQCSFRLSVNDLFSTEGASLDAKVSYCLLRNCHLDALLEVATRPAMQQAWEPMMDSLIFAVEAGYIREDNGLRARVGTFLDAFLTHQSEKVTVAIVRRYPQEWLKESSICMTALLEVDLGL